MPLVLVGNSHLGERLLNSTLTFYVQTLDTGGSALDADAVPGYSVYEEETGTAIVTGSMAKLDDAGTTGFYSEQVSLTDANGYELHKDYCIRMTATVDGQAAVSLYTLRIGPIDAVRSETAQAGAAGTITLDAGASATDDFYNGIGVQLIGGTGDGQIRLITDYVGSTKVATVAPNWTTTPGATSVFILRPWNGVDLQLWRASVPNALNAGRVDALVGAMDPNVITSLVIATGAIDADAIADNAIDAGAIAVGALDADAFTAGALGAIADGVWDEDIVAAHGTADTSGEIVSQLTKRAATLTTEVLDGSIIGQMLDDGTAVYDRTTDSLQAIRDAIPAGAPSVGAIADAVWDEATAGHNISGTFGQVLFPIRAGTAQGGGATTITLDALANANDDFYNGSLVFLTGGTGALQARSITDYVGATKVATISPAWATNPDATSVFVIVPAATVTGSSATPGDIADAVWDEARAGHVAAGTFGEGVASVQGNVTGSVGSVTGNVGGNVNGNVVGTVGSVAAGGITAASIATGAIDADALATDAVDEIVDQTWNELIAGHLGAGSTGEALNNAAAGGATPAAIADAVWDEATSGHLTSGTFGQAQNTIRANTAQGGGGTTITLDAGASAIDDFYNFTIVFVTGGTGAGQSRMISDYVGATKVATVNTAWGTNPDATSVFVILPFGSIPGAVAPSAADNANAVWDELTAEGRAVGSYGQLLKDDIDATISSRASAVALALVQADTDDLQSRVPATLNGGRMRSHVEAMDAAVVNQVVDQTWDEILAGHLAVGSTGEALSDAAAGGGGGGGGATASDVWNELKAPHQGETIMGNIAQDVDDLEFTGNEG